MAFAPCSAAVGIEGQRAREEVVARVAVGQRRDVDEDQPFLAIGDVRVAIERMDRLLFVLRDELRLAQRVHRHRRRQRHRGGELRLHERALAERRDRRADDALGEVLVVDVGDVVDVEAALPVGDEERTRRAAGCRARRRA